MIKRAVWKDLIEQGFVPDDGDDLNDFLLRCVNLPDGKPFVFIIDEWDAVIREAKYDDDAQEAYLHLLRGWYKNMNFTPKAVAAACMTGILPIKKVGFQSAVSDFKEFSVLWPGEYARFTGFSETEVQRICKRKRMSFEAFKTWYDGYDFAGSEPVYNPYSVMRAVEAKCCRSYWRTTSADTGLSEYIKMDFEGLQETVATLIAGSEVIVDTEGFQNDMERLSSRDDILTLLVHFGYLTYDSEKSAVRIPNKEVWTEFRTFLSKEDVGERWMMLIKRSDNMLSNTIAGNADDVAKRLDEIGAEQNAPKYSNDERSLSSVIKYAYLSAIGKCAKVIEIPSVKGLADVAFIPASGSKLPAMVIELKWNNTADGVIQQVMEKQYPAVIQPYEGHIVLCRINYDERTGKHTCEIEVVQFPEGSCG
ncbi:MAG: AAA family ATPase [Clostridia bacterium]|nr:AAA family ATPase [Clostridia bacterium]